MGDYIFVRTRVLFHVLGVAGFLISSPVWAGSFYVPPDIAGDLSATVAGDYIFISEDGTVSNNVLARGGNDTIINHGTVGNNIWGEDGNDYIVNYGTINGEIYGGNDDDVLINYGYVGVDLEGDDGNDVIINYGKVRSDLRGDAGDDLIINYGTIIVNDMEGGSGNDTMINYGFLLADEIFGNDGDDTIINYGYVASYVRGDDGDDKVENHGKVGDYLGGGDGNDTIVNSGTVGTDIRGDAGNDVVIMQSGPEKVGGNIDGGEDFDTIVYSGGTWVQNHFKVINFEDLAIDATRELTLSGPWDIGSRVAFVNGGTLNIPDSLAAGGLEINSGSAFIEGTLRAANVTNRGLLWGTGTIIGNTFNYGTISPGNSIGTLTMDGSYVHGQGAMYLAEINRNGASDLLSITGVAILNGGTVNTRLPRRLYNHGYSWTILRADGGVTGKFDMISGQPHSAVLSLKMAYSPVTASLYVDRKPYALFGNTVNEKAIGSSLDAIVPIVVGSGAEMERFLTSLDFDFSAVQIGQVLGAINPEMYTVFPSAARKSTSQFTGFVSHRIDQIQEASAFGMTTDSDASSEILANSMANGSETVVKADPLKRNWQLWGRMYGSNTDRDASSEHEGYQFRSNGIVFGSDGRVASRIRAGFALGMNNTDLDFETDDSGEQSSLLAGVYSEAGFDNFHFDLSLGFGWHEGDSRRLVDLPYSSYQVTPAVDSTSLQAHVRGDYLFGSERWLFGPVVGLDYASISTDGFSENSGSILDLKVEESKDEYFVSRLGVKIAGRLGLEEAVVFPRFGLSWLHDFSDKENDLVASFVDYPGNLFVITGAGLPVDVISAEGGITVQFGEKASAFMEVSATFGDDYSDYVAALGMDWRF